MNEFWARLLLAGIGMVCGAVPFVYSVVKRSAVLGTVIMVACGILSGIGFPYFAPVLAALGFWLIYSLNKKKEEKQTAQNNKLYRQKLREQQEAGREAMIGTIENRRTANAAWPPVNQVVDPVALKEFEDLLQKESDHDSAAK
ncbi:MAG: hypothetical protein PUC59_05315 [Firmicutes bacterium]|nr:hypothetical protein [Bacillota bacterium]